MTRFNRKRRLSPIYIGPYRVFKCYSKVIYELDLPAKLELMHLVFYVSLLKKCVDDLPSVVPLKSVGVKESVFYEEVPVEILVH